MYKNVRIENGDLVADGKHGAATHIGKYYESIPAGWEIDHGATTAPLGFAWIHNNKSRFDGERMQGLTREIAPK